MIDYSNHFKIINNYSSVGFGKIYEGDFDGYGGNDDYILIDKVMLSEIDLGWEIIDDLDESKITDDENYDFTNEFKDKMLTYIEEEITNEVSIDIWNCLLNYINKNISSKNKHKTVHDGHYKNHFEITFIDDGLIYGDDFNGYWENDWYTVIDIKLLGEELGLKIIDKLTENDIKKKSFTEDMLVYVEEEVTNKLRNEIHEHLLDYLSRNL